MKKATWIILAALAMGFSTPAQAGDRLCDECIDYKCNYECKPSGFKLPGRCYNCIKEKCAAECG
jgi:hypothetical protein